MDKDITTKKAVTEQVISMLYNNIIQENGNETFKGWCEDGEVFRISYPNESEEFYTKCNIIMDEISNLVDKITYDYLAEY